MTAALPVTRLDEVDPQSNLGLMLSDPSPEWTRRWIEHFLTVPNEIGQIVPMKLFPQQVQMLHNATGRDVTVKGRQTRASSLIMARNVRRMATGQVWGATCIMGAQDDQTTKTVFRQRIKHHLLNDLASKGLAIELAKDNDDEIVIKGLDNRFIFVSGEQRTMARGTAAQIIHFSEFGFWKDTALELLGGAIPSVPSAPYGWIDLESTPKGETGAFYKYAMNAKPFNPNDDFSVHLYPWWEEPRYVVSDNYYSNADIKMMLDDLAAEEMMFKPDDYEQRLMSGDNWTHRNLSVRQMIWRRRKKIAQDKTNAPFLQEYVEDLDTCWLGVQGRFFDTPDGIDHVQWYRDIRRDPIKWFESLPYKDDPVPLYNALGIWEFPDPLDTYVGGFDAAGGGLKDDSDWSVLYIMSVKKEKIVARLRVRAAPDTFASMIAAVGTFFKMATINGERSHHGDMVFKRLRELMYPNIYYHTDPFKPQKKNSFPEPGMYATENIRREVLEKFKGGITNNAFISFCKDLVREIGGFTWQKVQQRLKAAAIDIAEMHDDTIFAAAYCWYIVDKVRMRVRAAEKRNEDDILYVASNGQVVRRSDQNGYDDYKPWLQV